MEPVVIACGGCGVAIRIRHPEVACRRSCPRCGTALSLCPVQTEDLGCGHPELAAPEEESEPASARHLRLRLNPLELVLPTVAVFLTSALIMAAWDRWTGIAGDRSSEAGRSATCASLDTSKDGSLLAFRSPPSESGKSTLIESRPERSAVPQAIIEWQSSTIPDWPFSASREDMKADDRVPPLVPSAPPTGKEPARTLKDAPSSAPAERRFKVRDENGQPVVARQHGQRDRNPVLLLPDGQLGIPNMLIPTKEPFRPYTADELLARLKDGPLSAFQVLKTPHYLIFYQSSEPFAESSGRWLEDLYRRLLDAFRKHEMPVHDAEFPLVAVIYATEQAFRASHRVDREVQAFYDIHKNRIFFYETSADEANAPEVSALRKPQTVAHEGTHQILQNIGVHPRLSVWPLWLVEGLAEYCATPANPRKGGKPTWDGLGMINGLHMATIRELEDPLSTAVHGRVPQAKALRREPGKPLVESLIRKPQLNPTEYALAWAMTHYLAVKREDDFVAFLKIMSQIQPLQPLTPEDHLAEFRKAFGDDLAKVDKAIDAYLKKLSRQKSFDPMPFYAVTYEQALPAGLVRRAAMVSQSPQLIQQWIGEITSPLGAQPTWQALPHSTRARALLSVEEWTRGE